MSCYGSEKSLSPADLDSSLVDKDLSTAFPLLTPNPPLPPPLPHLNHKSESESHGSYHLDDDFQKSASAPDHQIPSETVVQSGSRVVEREGREDLQWNCSQCTYLNPGNYLCCLMCDDIRPADAQLDEKDNTPLEGAEQETGQQTSTAAEMAVPLEHANNPFYYQLVAVVRHVGKTAFSGHYTCDVRHKDPSRDSQRRWGWYRCDDSRVSEVSQVGRSLIPCRVFLLIGMSSCLDRNLCCHSKAIHTSSSTKDMLPPHRDLLSTVQMALPKPAFRPIIRQGWSDRPEGC
jgi:hypothetical protein